MVYYGGIGLEAMSVLNICVYVRGVYVLLQMSGDSSLTTIISDLQSAQSAQAQGRLWTRTFSSFPLHYYVFSLRPLILTCHSLSSVHAVPSSAFIPPVVSSVFLPLPLNPDHLSHCVFYQLIHFSSPRLLASSNLFLSISVSAVALSLSLSLLLSLWFLSIFSCSLWET